MWGVAFFIGLGRSLLFRSLFFGGGGGGNYSASNKNIDKAAFAFFFIVMDWSIPVSFM